MPYFSMRTLGSTFIKGLAAVLPIVVTLYLLYWLAGLAEAVVGGVMDAVLPFYFPGLGLLFAAVGIFLVGVLLNAWLVRKLFDLGEALMHRIPLVKTIYGAVQDLMQFFSAAGSNKASQVVTVTVTVGEVKARLLGVVTREDFESLPPELGGPNDIAVYLPMSYQVGGYTLMLPRDSVQSVDMSIDQAMRFAVTAGMSVSGNNNRKIRAPEEQA